MATIMELIGLAPFFSGSVPQVDPAKMDVAFRCGQVIMEAVKRDLKPRDICTRAAFNNAIATIQTNAGAKFGIVETTADRGSEPLSIAGFATKHGVAVNAGTVAISSSNISGNTASNVRALSSRALM